MAERPRLPDAAGAQTRLTADERAALAATIVASGGMLLISDDMSLLDAEAGKLFRAVAKIAEEIDSNAVREPVLALDLMTTGDVRGVISESADGVAIAMILNRADSPARVQTADLKLSTGEVVALNLRSTINSKYSRPSYWLLHSAILAHQALADNSTTLAPGPRAARLARFREAVQNSASRSNRD